MLVLNFKENRYKHCYGVGLKMFAYAKFIFKWDDYHAAEMFVLGNIHDIGYELDPDAFDHGWVLAELLGDSFKYVNEIKYHNKYQSDYDTPEMRLMYYGDMTVDGQGNFCTLDERLDDLEKRYGKNSEVYLESKNLANKIREWGFDDSLHEEWINLDLNMSEILKNKNTTK